MKINIEPCVKYKEKIKYATDLTFATRNLSNIMKFEKIHGNKTLESYFEL